MAIPRKLPFPDWLLVTPCTIVTDKEGLDENGNLVVDTTWTGNVVFIEKTKRILKPDNQVITLQGNILLKGSILTPDVFSSGQATVYPSTANSRTFRIYSCSRNRNPDGSIHSIYLELM